MDDIQAACRSLRRPVPSPATASDGFVSVEIDPRLADETDTLRRRRQGAVQPCRPAQRDDQGAGHRGRRARHRRTARRRRQRQRHAHLRPRPLRRGAAAHGSAASTRAAPAGCRPPHSVGSFFVSRVDTEVDKRLEAIGTDAALALRGKVGRRPSAGRLRQLPVLRGQRRPAAAAAAAVGVDEHEEPGLPRAAVRRDADRARHRQHVAAAHARGARRPRGDVAGTVDDDVGGGAGNSGGGRRRWHRHGRRRQRARTRRRRWPSPRPTRSCWPRWRRSSRPRVSAVESRRRWRSTN